MDNNKWPLLCAELVRSMAMLQDRVRLLEADSRFKAGWLRYLLEKDAEYLENRERMPESQRELLDAVMNPETPEGQGTSHGLLSQWSHEDYEEQEDRLHKLIEGIINE
jgi:hypothetical protein